MKPVFTGSFAREWDEATTPKSVGNRIHEEIERGLRTGEPFDIETWPFEPGKYSYPGRVDGYLLDGLVDWENLELRAAASSFVSRSPLAKRKRGRGQGARRRRMREARRKRRWAQMSPIERLNAAWFAAFPEAARMHKAMRKHGVQMFDQVYSPTGRFRGFSVDDLRRWGNPGRKP